MRHRLRSSPLVQLERQLQPRIRHSQQTRQSGVVVRAVPHFHAEICTCVAVLRVRQRGLLAAQSSRARVSGRVVIHLVASDGGCATVMQRKTNRPSLVASNATRNSSRLSLTVYSVESPIRPDTALQQGRIAMRDLGARATSATAPATGSPSRPSTRRRRAGCSRPAR
jgi:hypothetical protein